MVEAYLSVQSAYCYLAAPRLQALAREPGIVVRVRLVRPGVLRFPDAYDGRGDMEATYFRQDVARTAAYLGLSYAEANPAPAIFAGGSFWRAAPGPQTRFWALMDLLLAAGEGADGLTAYATAMGLIWGGTAGWDREDRLPRALAEVGLDPGALATSAAATQGELRARLDANDAALLAAGHWGVPCCVHDGEPFYGQDRLPQLAWRLGLDPSRY